MKELISRAIQKRKFKITTDYKHNFPIKENLLKREFDVSIPNKTWVLI